MLSGKEPVVHITVRGSDGGAIVEAVEPLSPYLLDAIVDYARVGGGAAETEVRLPFGTSSDEVEAIEARLTRRCGHSRSICVVRDGGAAAPRAPAGRLERAVPARDTPSEDAPDTVAEADVGMHLTLMVRVGKVLHEIQRERGYAAVYSASAYRVFGAEWAVQQRAADEAVVELRTFIASHGETLVAPLLQSATAARETLARLPALRTYITVGGHSGARVIEMYDPSVTSLLAVVHMVAAIESDAELTRLALAYAAFLHAKEQGGCERAEVAAAWAVDGLEPDPLSVESSIAAQSAFLRVFEMAGSPAAVDELRTRTGDPTWEAVAAMERRARRRGSTGQRPDAASWFACMTAKLDALRHVEDLQLEAMLRRATLTRRH